MVVIKPQLMQSMASQFLTSQVKRHTHGCGIFFFFCLIFGQIFALDQAEKKSEEDLETTITRLRTLQHFVKNWKENGEPLS